MRFTVAAIMVCALHCLTLSHQNTLTAEEDVAVLEQNVISIDETEVPMEGYSGDVLMIVNVASRCGLTPQYAQLQAVFEKYESQGFKVLGFPCNQFGGQEPGSLAEIKEFCTSKYDVSFPMFAKIDVNGDDAAPLYQTLTQLDVEPAGKGPIQWNFEKFIVARNGEVVARFSPRVKPDAEAVVSVIEEELAKPRS